MVVTAPFLGEDVLALLIFGNSRFVRLKLLLPPKYIDKAAVKLDRPDRIVAFSHRRDEGVNEGRSEVQYPHPPEVEVHIGPAQPHELSDAKPGTQEKGPDRPGPVLFHQA